MFSRQAQVEAGVHIVADVTKLVQAARDVHCSQPRHGAPPTSKAGSKAGCTILTARASYMW